MLYSKHFDIKRFKNACIEFINASEHKVSNAKVIGDEVHLQYKEAGTGDVYHVVFKPWV
jgi:5-methylthioribose kinase